MSVASLTPTRTRMLLYREIWSYRGAMLADTKRKSKCNINLCTQARCIPDAAITLLSCHSEFKVIENGLDLLIGTTHSVFSEGFPMNTRRRLCHIIIFQIISTTVSLRIVALVHNKQLSKVKSNFCVN